ncbi:MAG: hypothetical protein ACI4M9_07945, partial [Succinivibrio sp.]
VVKMCFALRLPEVECEYVVRLCNDIFGHEKAAPKKTSKSASKKTESKAKAKEVKEQIAV